MILSRTLNPFITWLWPHPDLPLVLIKRHATGRCAGSLCALLKSLLMLLMATMAVAHLSGARFEKSRQGFADVL